MFEAFGLHEEEGTFSVAIKFSKGKSHAGREKLKILEDSLRVCYDECSKNPFPENAEKLEVQP